MHGTFKARVPSRCYAVVQDATGKECGLHSDNVVESAAEQAKEDVRDLWQDGQVEALTKEQLQGMMDGKRDKDTMLVMYAPWCQYSQVSCHPVFCLLVPSFARSLTHSRNLAHVIICS